MLGRREPNRIIHAVNSLRVVPEKLRKKRVGVVVLDHLQAEYLRIIGAALPPQQQQQQQQQQRQQQQQARQPRTRGSSCVTWSAPADRAAAALAPRDAVATTVAPLCLAICTRSSKPLGYLHTVE